MSGLQRWWSFNIKHRFLLLAMGTSTERCVMFCIGLELCFRRHEHLGASLFASKWFFAVHARTRGQVKFMVGAHIDWVCAFWHFVAQPVLCCYVAKCPAHRVRRNVKKRGHKKNVGALRHFTTCFSRRKRTLWSASSVSETARIVRVSKVTKGPICVFVWQWFMTPLDKDLLVTACVA